MKAIIWPLCLAAVLYTCISQAQTMRGDAVLPQATQEESAASLTLEQALQLAVSANPELAIARRELDAVAAARVQAAVFRNPEVSVEMEDTRASSRQTTYWLGQPFELGGKRGARIESAERARDVADAELQIRFAVIRAAVMQRFYEVLAAQERYRLAQSSMELANRGLDVASRRVTAGKVSPVEETRARVAASAARIELTQANAEMVNARRRLAALWGNPDPCFTEAAGALEILPDLPELGQLTDLVAQAPETVRAEQEVSRREAMLKLEESRRYPDLILRGGVQRRESVGETVNVVGLALSIPIFDRNQGNILEARMRADKARDERLSTDVRLRSDLSQAHQRLAAAIQEVSLIRSDILPGAQSALDATTRGFELGKFDFLDVLDAQRTLFLARGQYIRALGEVQRAVADVESILGPQGASLFAAHHGRE
ncbi:TolC family protein [Methylobacillus arboreus]|uniref:TolC family protein n=1 Tax=Methylobacillus arboreus TaxID=755170 RepID=UPI001E3D245F|nr:TolC family protein [Methylobacillus arboreus]MCB5190782.1 TolC family protein [Methylobacillus arboreus]